MSTNLEKAKIDPTTVYTRPSDVLRDPNLTREQKVDILRRWAYDERERAVAEEENMQGPADEPENMLDEILRCLIALGVDKDQDRPPATKQG